MPVTPYVVGQWVRGERFYGRREILDEVLYGNRNCLWLLGTRRVGKTSILKQLEYLTSENDELGYFSLFWDFQGAEKPEDLDEGFSESLLDALDRLDALGIPLDRVESNDLFESLSKLRRELKPKKLTLLLLGDEVEELVQVNERSPRFLRRLRRALQSTENIRTVFASKIKLWELASEETSTSPFLHGFTPPLFVSSLSEEDAISLITQTKLPTDARPRLDRAEVELISTRCNNHPYLLQLLCERHLETGDLEIATEAIANDQMVRHFFAVDFEMLIEEERNVIRMIGERGEASSNAIRQRLAAEASALKGDLSRLQHFGFIRKTAEGSFRLANLFFERWFQDLPSVHRAHHASGPGGEVLDPTVQDANRGAVTSDELPERIDARYELLERLGEGATCDVYKAFDTLLQVPIAMKVFKPEYGAEDEASVRLSREVALSRDLTHPNVLKIYHLGDAEGRKYVTMQLVEGANLAEILHREAPLSVPRAVAITKKLASALDAAHGAKVLHRDIKPSNILIDGNGEPRIADFGLARLLDGPEVTRTGSFVGTPVYASPEQVKGESLDERSDIYSLGVVAFEMLTGRRPFTSVYADEVARMHVEVEPPPPRELRPEVPEGLSCLVLRCLAKTREDRVQSARELMKALEAFEPGGEPARENA